MSKAVAIKMKYSKIILLGMAAVLQMAFAEDPEQDYVHVSVPDKFEEPVENGSIREFTAPNWDGLKSKYDRWQEAQCKHYYGETVTYPEQWDAKNWHYLEREIEKLPEAEKTYVKKDERGKIKQKIVINLKTMGYRRWKEWMILIFSTLSHMIPVEKMTMQEWNKYRFEEYKMWIFFFKTSMDEWDKTLAEHPDMTLAAFKNQFWLVFKGSLVRYNQEHAYMEQQRKNEGKQKKHIEISPHADVIAPTSQQSDKPRSQTSSALPQMPSRRSASLPTNRPRTQTASSMTPSQPPSKIPQKTSTSQGSTSQPIIRPRTQSRAMTPSTSADRLTPQTTPTMRVPQSQSTNRPRPQTPSKSPSRTPSVPTQLLTPPASPRMRAPQSQPTNRSRPQTVLSMPSASPQILAPQTPPKTHENAQQEAAQRRAARPILNVIIPESKKAGIEMAKKYALEKREANRPRPQATSSMPPTQLLTPQASPAVAATSQVSAPQSTDRPLTKTPSRMPSASTQLLTPQASPAARAPPSQPSNQLRTQTATTSRVAASQSANRPLSQTPSRMSSASTQILTPQASPAARAPPSQPSNQPRTRTLSTEAQQEAVQHELDGNPQQATAQRRDARPNLRVFIPGTKEEKINMIQDYAREKALHERALNRFAAEKAQSETVKHQANEKARKRPHKGAPAAAKKGDNPRKGNNGPKRSQSMEDDDDGDDDGDEYDEDEYE